MLNISSEKVEKVVNPPHKPILKNKLNLKLGSKELIIPMSKEPTKLIIKVETENAKFSKIGIWPNKYLATEPMNPPKPTSKTLTINYHLKKIKMPMTLLIP